MIQCQACGAENAPDSAYCSQCARKLDTATQESIARQRAEHTATGIRWNSVVLALSIILILIVIVALLVTHVL